MAGRIVVFMIFCGWVSCRTTNKESSNADSSKPSLVQERDTLFFNLGDTLTITLLAAFNTGFIWVAQDSSAHIKIIGSDFDTATGQLDTMKFLLLPTFREDTCINIDFLYKRPWEDVDIENNKLHTYTICNN